MSDVSQNFYHMMLGLPAEVSAPDYYELLGVERFEDDVERIHGAAIDRNRQLLSWQNSEFHRDADRLMNEVVAAREVLSEPQKRAAYDRRLGYKAPATRGPRERHTTDSPAEPQLAPGPDETEFPIASQRLPARVRGKKPKTPKSLPAPQPSPWAEIDWRIAVPAGAVLVSAILVGSWLLFRGGKASAPPLASSQEITSPPPSSEMSQPALSVPASDPVVTLPPNSPEISQPTAQEFAGMNAGDRRELTGEKTAFRWCPAGSFKMGSPATETSRISNEDQVMVTLTRGFWLQETEVTQGEWQALMGTAPWKGESFVNEGARYAATHVSQNGSDSAESYCVKLTARERAAGRLPPDWGYRLPTEAEWEYACRAGTTTAYSFESDPTQLGEYAWYYQNTFGENHAHVVGLKKPNAWGLCDMHGNVGEWCQDMYVAQLAGGTDPLVTTGGTNRVYRGGVWFFAPADCRSAYRSWYLPGFRGMNLGFRPLAVLSR